MKTLFYYRVIREPEYFFQKSPPAVDGSGVKICEIDSELVDEYNEAARKFAAVQCKISLAIEQYKFEKEVS